MLEIPQETSPPDSQQPIDLQHPFVDMPAGPAGMSQHHYVDMPAGGKDDGLAAFTDLAEVRVSLVFSCWSVGVLGGWGGVL